MSRPRTDSISSQILSEGKFEAIFPGWGGSRVVALNCSEEGSLKVIADTTPATEPSKQQGVGKKKEEEHHNVGLTPVFSISIAGCDLMGSCLYTAGVCTSNSGKLAPAGLFLVTLMLFFFKKVYSEVVTAIPVNGGTYNVMLNTSTKKVAAFVACLSILSYVATAIVSAFDSILYLALIWPSVDIRIATLIVLGGFGCVTICGVGESAGVAAMLVGVHTTILTVLIIWGFIYGVQDNFQIFSDNMFSHFPDVVDSTGLVLAHRSPGAALYFGYCSALLGITGFETASNYVEEMRDPGVFVTTVNWMWVLVGIYNPLLSIMSMMVLPLPVIYEHPSEMLAVMAGELGGDVFHTIMCVNAVTILCGGVLTAIVGVSGLIKRLAYDQVLPSFLGATNSRGAAHMAIIAFVGVSMSLFLAIFDPADPTAINNFGGVFAISFLSVLVAFAIAAVLLKLYRAKLARMVIAKWWEIILSLSAVFVGLIGNIVLTPTVFSLFLIYLSGFLSVAVYMFMKVEVFTFGIWMLRKMNLSDEKRALARRTDLEILAACEHQAQYDERRALLSQDQIGDKENTDPNSPVPEAPPTPSHYGLRNRTIGTGVDSSDKMDGEYSVVSGSDSGIEMQAAPSTPKRTRRYSMDEEKAVQGDGLQFERDEGTVTRLMVWGDGLIHNVKKGLGQLTLNLALPHHDTRKPRTVTELEVIMQKPMMGKVLNYLMTSLDTITSAPFVYLAKTPDPISIHRAVDYITANEMTNHIYVVHFVDDRKAIRMRTAFLAKAQQQAAKGRIEAVDVDKYSNTLLMQMFQEDNNMFRDALGTDGDDKVDGAEFDFDLHSAVKSLPPNAKKLVDTVTILDAFYTYKKIHCIIVRGAYFCPSALNCLSEHLGVAKNAMVMGVPDMKFDFPFAKLNGVRLGVSSPDPVLTAQASMHMFDVLSAQFANEQAWRKAAEENAAAAAEAGFAQKQPSSRPQDNDEDAKKSNTSVSGEEMYQL